MTNIKKYFISILYTILSIVTLFLIITTLYYFNIFSPTTYNILKIIILLLSFSINSFSLGKKALRQGYLEGIKLSLPLIIIFLLIAIISKLFTIKVLLLYFIIIITSSFGSMLGISTKKEL